MLQQQVGSMPEPPRKDKSFRGEVSKILQPSNDNVFSRGIAYWLAYSTQKLLSSVPPLMLRADQCGVRRTKPDFGSSRHFSAILSSFASFSLKHASAVIGDLTGVSSGAGPRRRGALDFARWRERRYVRCGERSLDFQIPGSTIRGFVRTKVQERASGEILVLRRTESPFWSTLLFWQGTFIQITIAPQLDNAPIRE